MPSSVLVALRVATTPERAFEVFTSEIGDWWRPNLLFRFTPKGTGRLSLEAHEGGRLLETYGDGSSFEIGQVRVWQPPERLVLSWRQASFALEQETEVHVSFEPAGDETRVTVRHYGWDAIPPSSAAKHGFPNQVFSLRQAEYWRALLTAFRARAT